MKKTVVWILTAILLAFTVPAEAVKYYGATSLTSGGGALAALDGNSLADGDFAVVRLKGDATYGSVVFFFVLDATSGAVQSLPNIVSPATNAGTKRWVRVKEYIAAGETPVMQTGTNPAVTSPEKLTHDTNGAAYVNDRIVRAVDNSANQWVVGQKLVGIPFAFVKPQSWPDTVRDKWIPWYNETGMTFNIVRVLCTADSSAAVAISTTFGRTNSTVASTIGTININLAGTGVYYRTVSAASLTSTTISHQAGVAFDFDDIADPGQGECLIQGWFNAAVD